MPGEGIQIGPFLGGLNTFSDDTSVADNEMPICENFELDLDGSLVSRPPIVRVPGNMPLGATGNPQLLGYYYGPGDVPYLLASDGLSSTFYYTGSSWTLITNTIAASAMAQFDGKAWLLAPNGSVNPGGTWSPTAGFAAEANMPRGESVVAHKFRLWVAPGKNAVTNPTRMYFSNVLGSPTFWQAAPAFIDVGAGDGQSIVALTIYFNNLLIFRSDSIYSFQFTADPTSGTVALAVPGVGLASKDSFAFSEKYIYFLYDDKAYEFINFNASQINVKVPFEAENRTGIAYPYGVSTMNKRVIFTFWDQTYVFGLKTRTWTTWRSAEHGALGPMRTTSDDGVLNTGFLFSSKTVPAGGSRIGKLLSLEDGTTDRKETFTCTMQTKNFNYEASSTYKRLFWWGVDAVFRGRVIGVATPVTFNQAITWEQLRQYTWADLLAFRWDQPASPGTAVETIRNTTGSGSVRKFVKFRKALRFRQIYFRLVFDTDGSRSTAPVRVFSIMSFVRAHERVSKDVT